MCTPGSADALIVGTILGSLFLYDLKNSESDPNLALKYNFESLLQCKITNYSKLEESKKQHKLQLALIKYQIQTHSFMTDGLKRYPHFSPIQKLVFIQKHDSGLAEIGVLDQMGMVSTWSVIEMHTNLVTDFDLNMSIGGKFKLSIIYSDNLMNYQSVIDMLNLEDLNQSLDIEFDPSNPLIFFFSTSDGLFRINKQDQHSQPVKLDTQGLNTPTAISISDRGFLLAAFSCGSIA